MHACMHAYRENHPSIHQPSSTAAAEESSPYHRFSHAHHFSMTLRERKKSNLKSCLRLYADVWEDSTWHVLICFYSD
ncbi:hypothetical protein NC651_020839 [Populus alba x Populus x berolinensis]|nr:hypothetical protein NC651_020839 [Populus alba x Populus x berolinensis]